MCLVGQDNIFAYGVLYWGSDIPSCFAGRCWSFLISVIVTLHCLLGEEERSGLGFQHGLGDMAQVWWATKGEMLWSQLFPMLCDFLDIRLSLQVLLIHLSENYVLFLETTGL